MMDAIQKKLLYRTLIIVATGVGISLISSSLLVWILASSSLVNDLVSSIEDTPFLIREFIIFKLSILPVIVWGLVLGVRYSKQFATLATIVVITILLTIAIVVAISILPSELLFTIRFDYFMSASLIIFDFPDWPAE